MIYVYTHELTEDSFEFPMNIPHTVVTSGS